MEAVIFEEELKYVYNIAYKLTLNKSDSEDLAQETLIKAWEKKESLKNSSARKGWLKKICLNLFYMKIRKKKGYKEFTIDMSDNYNDKVDTMQIRDDRPLPEKELLVKEEIAIIRDNCFLGMAQKLTLNQRMVFMVVDVFGLNFKEASELIDISEEAVKAQLYRGRKRLNQFFLHKCHWFNIESVCRCEAYLEFQQDIYNKKQRVKPSAEYFELQDDDSYIVNDNVNEKIIGIYKNIPDYYPADEWFDEMINLLKKKLN